MRKLKITNHPSRRFQQELASICKPLKELNITYFSHVRLEKNNQFSALNNHPDFMEHYLNHEYYNVGIHMAETNKWGHYIVVDELESKGLSAKMHHEAAEFGVKHFFTIIHRSKHDVDQYYHFASNSSEKSINQTYLTNLDLLKLFIQHFQTSISQSKALSSAYDTKFIIDPKAEGFSHCGNEFIDLEKKRSDFLNIINKNKQSTLMHKDTHQSLLLSTRQKNCLYLLCKGNSAKEIAAILNLSNRTIENYLLRIRRILGCKNIAELVACYVSQVVHHNFN